MSKFDLLEQSWKRIEKRIAEHSKYITPLNPGATEADIAKLEETVEVKLPPDLLHSLKLHNGDRSEQDAVEMRSKGDSDTADNEFKSGVICGLELMPIDRIIGAWQDWRELDDSDDSEYECVPEGSIQSAYTNPGWIGLAYDAGGNYLGVDLAPGPNGVVGQVINFGPDENTRYVIAQSWSEFISMVAQDHQKCSFDFNDGTLINDPSVEDRDIAHYTDFLTARCRLKAGR